MQQISFILGSVAIAAAMAIRLNHPAPAPEPVSEEETEKDAPSQEEGTKNESAPDIQELRKPKLVIPPISPDLFAPALTEFQGEEEAKLRKRLAHYQQTKDEVRALLTVERLLEIGIADSEIQETWTDLLKSAPLWQPDPKERKSVSFQITVILPAGTSWDENSAKQNWQQTIVKMSGGIILPKISIMREQGATPQLRLNQTEPVSINFSELKPQVEQAFAKALQQTAALSGRTASSLKNALTRYEWQRISD